MMPSDQDARRDEDNPPAGSADASAAGPADASAAGSTEPASPPEPPAADAGPAPDAQRNEALQKAIDDSIGAAGAGPAV